MNTYERIFNIITEAMGAKEHAAAISKAELPRVKKTISKKIAAKWNTSQEGIAQARGSAAETLRHRRLNKVKGRRLKTAVAQTTSGEEHDVDIPRGKK